MKKIILAVFITALLLCPAARAQNFGGQDNTQERLWMKNLKPFQAEVVTTIIEKSGRKIIHTSKYYFMTDKIRSEDPKEQSVMIMDLAKKVTYFYNKQSNSWMKFSQKETKTQTAAGTMTGMKSQKLPDTVIDGKVCEATQYIMEDPKMKSTSIVYVWKGKNIPLKITGEVNGTKTEVLYKNIVFTSSPNSLFAPPAGAQVTDMSQYMNTQMKQK